MMEVDIHDDSVGAAARAEFLTDDAREQLVRTAVQSIDYVAFGKVMAKMLCVKHGVELELAESYVMATAVELTEAVGKLADHDTLLKMIERQGK